MSERWTRRAVLAGLGSAVFAGCTSSGDVTDTDGGGTPTPTGAPRTSTTTGSRSETTASPPSTTATETERPPTHETTTQGPVPEPPGSVDTEWPVPGADAGRSNYASGATGPTERVAELWYFIANTTFSAPVLADGTVYVGGDDGSVRALDARSSEERWQRSVDASAGTPWVVGDRLFVPTGEAIVALERSDGAEAWRVETRDRAAVQVSEHGVYWLAENEPAVVALARDDGSERWRTAISHPWAPTVFANDATVFVSSGTYDSRFWTLSVDTGEVVGPEPRQGADFPAEQFVVDDTVYAVDAFFGTVRATAVGDAGNGWSQGVSPGGGGAGQLSGGSDRVYYTSNADDAPGVYALSKTDGTIEWTADVGATIDGRPVVADETVIVPTDGGVRCFDPVDGTERWARSDVGSRFIVADDVLYATGNGRGRAFRSS